MALPTLDATFASAADLPRRQMLAKWLVEELGETQAPSSVLVSGAGSDVVNGTYTYTGLSDGKPYYNLPVSTDTDRSAISWLSNQWIIWGDGNESQYSSTDDVEFPWQVTTWTGEDGAPPMPTVTEIPQPSPIANYYSLPERYLWAKIAVAAGAPRGEADYISLPKNYAWSDIYNAVSGDIANSTVVVSGAGSAFCNGLYVKNGENAGRPQYVKSDGGTILWDNTSWLIDGNNEDADYQAEEDVTYPWLVTSWYVSNGESPIPVVVAQTPNHTDWSEKQALGHIAAAYRGDTGNPEALATYISWPWRYKVASIITAL